MRLSYGSYQFDDNACIIASRAQVMKNAGGQMYSRLVSHEVIGYLSGSSQSAITSAMNQLLTALARPFQNLVFKQDDGSNSATILDNAASISGVTIVDGPNFVESNGAEYSTQRKFSFTAQAEYPLNNTNNLLLKFSEKIDFSGGGPKRVIKEAIVGPAQVQQVREQAAYYAVQSGSAEGYRSEPPIPPPIWPDALLHAPEISRMSPDRVGRGYQRYEVSWSYRFGSPSPLVGRPNLWLI